ncbi:hypothetical protein [Cupriavidus taiwanensis]|nr:hypothetical protein [Cupriavidus taiwanensis]
MFFKEGGGITFASSWKTWPDGEVIGSLAHEIGHFANVKADTDFKSAYAVPSSSPDAYAMSAMVGLHQEGEAVYNNWVVQQEILSNNGPQIYLAGEYKANPDGSVSSTGLQSSLDTQHATDIRSSSLIGSDRQILIDSAMGVYATLPNSVNRQAYFNYYGAASGAQAPAPGTLQSVTFTNNNATNQIGSMSENYSSGNTIQVKFTGTAPSTSTVTNPSGNLLTENVYTSATVNANNATVNLLNGATATVNGTGNTINAGNNVTVTANGTNNTINTGANDLVCTSNNVCNVGANVATGQSIGLTTVDGNGDKIYAENPHTAVDISGQYDTAYGNNDSINFSGSTSGDAVDGTGDSGADWAGVAVDTSASTSDPYPGGSGLDCPDGIDPIIFNLAGGGVQTQGLNTSAARFDMQNSGQADRTGWGTAGEGYLLYDPNDTDNTTAITQDSQLVAGFGALQSLAQQVDGMGTGTLGASDALWQTLKVWGDTTGTGQFQSGQLYTLDQLGIAGINLDATHISQDSNGNTILDDGTYTRADGTTGDIAEVNLMFNPGNGQTPSAADTFAQKQVNQLIQAMAAYAPDAAGSIVAQALPQDQTTLQLAAH